jgi:hypothetical protein
LGNTLQNGEWGAQLCSPRNMSIHDQRFTLDVTWHHFTFTQPHGRSGTIFIHKTHISCAPYAFLRRAMKYNELKATILTLLTTEGWCDSNRIIERARSESGLSASSRAIRMALLRYHRYGLLNREWRRGEYVYKLSDRGARRLMWLRGLTTDQMANATEFRTNSGLD